MSRTLRTRLLYIMFFIFGWPLASIFGQDPDVRSLMTRRTISPSDVNFNALRLMPKYLREEKSDSAKMLARYWEAQCGLTEPIQRVKLLISISEDSFTLADLNISLLQSLEEYVKLPTRTQEYNLVGESFDQFTYNFAAQLAVKTTRSFLQSKGLRDSIAYVLCSFYASDRLAAYGQLEGIKETILHEPDIAEHKKGLGEQEYHFEIYSGLWIPTGNAGRFLGNHPLFGFTIGGKKHRYLYDLTFEARMAKAKKDYQTVYQGALISTDHFFGGFFGIDLGRELQRTSHHEIDLLGGIGLDGFDIVDSRKVNGVEKGGKSINSFNVNTGVGYRIYASEYNGPYLGAEFRINLVNYPNSGGTRFSGIPLTLRIVIGFTGNRNDYSLKWLFR